LLTPVSTWFVSHFVSHAYSKHAEVTVPSLADWEKEW